MNRVELMRAFAAHTAAAAACERALKDPAETAAVEEGIADGWKKPGVGKLEVSLTRDAASVVDEDRFLDWLEQRYPTEVVTVRRVRNPEWQTRLLAGLIPVDPDEVAPGEATLLADAEGEIVPGVAWRAGGRPRCVSITIEPGLKHEYAAAAQAYVDHGTPLPIGLPARPALPQQQDSTVEASAPATE